MGYEGQDFSDIAGGVSPMDGPMGQRIFEEVTAAGRRIQETRGPESPVGRTLAELDMDTSQIRNGMKRPPRSERLARVQSISSAR